MGIPIFATWNYSYLHVTKIKNNFSDVKSIFGATLKIKLHWQFTNKLKKQWIFYRKSYVWYFFNFFHKGHSSKTHLKLWSYVNCTSDSRNRSFSGQGMFPELIIYSENCILNEVFSQRRAQSRVLLPIFKNVQVKPPFHTCYNPC